MSWRCRWLKALPADPSLPSGCAILAVGKVRSDGEEGDKKGRKSNLGLETALQLAGEATLACVVTLVRFWAQSI